MKKPKFEELDRNKVYLITLQGANFHEAKAMAEELSKLGINGIISNKTIFLNEVNKADLQGALEALEKNEQTT